MATERWQTTFDLIGLTAYITLMTGELPDSEFLRQARRGAGLQLVELPASADRPAEAEPPVKVGQSAKTAEAAA